MSGTQLRMEPTLFLAPIFLGDPALNDGRRGFEKHDRFAVDGDDKILRPRTQEPNYLGIVSTVHCFRYSPLHFQNSATSRLPAARAPDLTAYRIG